MILPASASEPSAPVMLILRRLAALVLRHVYLLMGSGPRMLETLYWPAFNMIVWGYVNRYIAEQSPSAIGLAVAILAGAILWEIALRSQFGVLNSFFEELWSRNLGHIFVSPLPPLAYALGLMLLSLLRMLIAMIPCAGMAWLVFDWNIADLGLPLIGFALNLAVTGWWAGFLIIAMLLRYGLAAEWMAWMATALLAPFVAVYYPVTVLPEWLQFLSWSLPPTYVFEGMRELLNHQEARLDWLMESFGLNLVYLAVALLVYKRAFESTRRRGGLLQMGE